MKTFKTATTRSEALDIIYSMAIEEIKDLCLALLKVNNTFGLDMRTEFYLDLMQSRLERPEYAREQNN